MREPWQFQYFKSVFLEMSIVTLWSVFPNPVTYMEVATGVKKITKLFVITKQATFCENFAVRVIIFY